ncbi:hypothetical protein PPHE_a0839 [Pseudoalteromonas phenolica O-BC30]|nr:hypothetical protein [Pseudoalteromonas phenolica O-BC30]
MDEAHFYFHGKKPYNAAQLSTSAFWISSPFDTPNDKPNITPYFRSDANL